VGSAQVVGENGNEMPVLIEVEWQDGKPAPDASELQYLLTAA
jgi:hypothetical protein